MAGAAKYEVRLIVLAPTAPAPAPSVLLVGNDLFLAHYSQKHVTENGGKSTRSIGARKIEGYPQKR
jgi:hypothetical protein